MSLKTLSSFFTFTVVCYGTENVLSVTGTSHDQYNLMQQRYTGCEIVMGNLEITLMEHNRNFSFLQVTRQQSSHCHWEPVASLDTDVNQPVTQSYI